MSLVAAVLLVAAALGGALHQFVDSASSPSNSHKPLRQRQLEVGEQNGGIAYGDTAKQLLAKLGSPTKKAAGCWIYNANAHTINGHYLGEVVDAMKFCFADGPVGGKVVSTIYEHLVRSAVATLPEDKQPAGGWIHPFNTASPGSEKLKF